MFDDVRAPLARRAFFSTKEYASSKDADVGYSFDYLPCVVFGKSHQSEPRIIEGWGKTRRACSAPRVFSSAELKEGLNDESTQNELKEILRGDGVLGVNTSGILSDLKKTVL